MSKNKRRITKQKWYGETKSPLSVNFNNEVNFIDENGRKVVDRELIKAYIEKNTNDDRSNLFKVGKEVKLFKELKKHELNCLERNYKFVRFYNEESALDSIKNEEIFSVKYAKENIRNCKVVYEDKKN